MAAKERCSAANHTFSAGEERCSASPIRFRAPRGRCFAATDGCFATLHRCMASRKSSFATEGRSRGSHDRRVATALRRSRRRGGRWRGGYALPARLATAWPGSGGGYRAFTSLIGHFVTVTPLAVRVLTGTRVRSKSSSRTRTPLRPSREMCAVLGMPSSVLLTCR